MRKQDERNTIAMNDVSVVLAHGGWADGSSWARVITGLAAHGIKAVAAPLPLTELADDVAALNRSIERVPGPVVLAAHAYAGAVIGLARPERVKALVYVNCVRARRRRKAHRPVLSRRAASAGAEARAGQR